MQLVHGVNMHATCSYLFVYYKSVLPSALVGIGRAVLQELARKIPNTVLHGRADCTAKKYLGAFRRWKLWTSQHQFPVLPAKPAHVALYRQHNGGEVQSKSAAEEVCNALASPTSSPLVKATLQAESAGQAGPEESPCHS